MDQEKKKINVKIVVPIVAIVIIAIVGIVIFASRNKEEKGLSANQCIGTWESADKNSMIILYQGGTGKHYINLNIKEYSSYSSIKWEIKDNVLNTSNSISTTGYKVKNGTITSLDGQYTYYKTK